MSTINRSMLYKHSLIISTLFAIIVVYIIYLFNFDLILLAFRDYEGALQVVIVISIRIFLLLIICIYLFSKWFKQEAQFLSDIPFLLGLFFLVLIFGKATDLLWNLTFYTFNDDIVLLFLKFRFFIIITEVAPLIYLGMEIIFFRLEDRFSKLKDKDYMNRLRVILITLIIIIETIIIIAGPNFTIMGIILPIILIPSLLGIVYIFYMAYRLNRLKVVKPGILTIGFFLYMLSNIFRPVMQNLLGETATYIIVVEIVDIIIFVIIFLGLYKK
ncbi:MAG: hypothetical protein ACFE88_14360 [Candidatus Hermodarchaeota archaeon]